MLNVDQLKFSYNSRPLIQALSFECEEGEALFLKGQNGSGKTTLLKILAGILPSTGVKLNGVALEKIKNIEELVSFIPVRIGGLYAAYTGNENIDLFSRLLKTSVQYRMDRWGEIKAFELALTEKFCNCSTGMKQLLNIFVLTLNGPKLILGDELFKVFDEETRKQVKAVLFQEFPQASFVFSSHEEECSWPGKFKILESTQWS